MVVDMKESQLAVLLPQDEKELLRESEENRVENVKSFNSAFLHVWLSLMLIILKQNMYRVAELYDLGEEKPPADSGHLGGAKQRQNAEMKIVLY